MSARKALIGFVLLAVLAAAVWLGLTINQSTGATSIGTKAYHLEHAMHSEAQHRGLSGRDSLPRDAGMLFSYRVEKEHCFWMKNMQFPIDIIWIGASRRITHIERNVSPETYPKQFCAPAQYILELNAGEAEAAGLREGQTIKF